jgi:putative membrane protein
MWRAEQLLWSWLANAVALGVCVAVMDRVSVDGAGSLITAALLFGILNTFLKPLVKLITLPLAVITLRIAWFFVAMLMLWLTSVIVDGFDIHGFRGLFWATIVIWVVNLVLDLVPGPWRGSRRERQSLIRRES